jgi:chemotaxis protein methyltransferase CheR
MIGADITDQEFAQLRRFFENASGIRLADSKKVLVCGRLSRRLRHFGIDSYRDYLSLIESDREPGERQMAIDLLTTNETHFFREPKHFEVLRQELTARVRGGMQGPLRIWSAASSTGEEAYSLAMTLTEVLGDRPWSVFASDLSTKVLNDARLGIYPKQRADEIPRHLAQRYLLEGFDENEGLYRIEASLRKRVSFQQINLMEPLPKLELFDMIFLRNVLIYFDNEGKRKIVESVARKLKPGGMLFIGHSETLSGITDMVKPMAPTVYRLH